MWGASSNSPSSALPCSCFRWASRFRFDELSPVRAVAIGGAVMQMVLTIAFGFGFAEMLGWSWRPAIWFGALISLSSTMVALKTLQAQGRLDTLSSRVMLGMLVVQDLAVVPLMIILPELSNPAGGAIRVVLATGRALLLLAVIVVVATRIVPRLMAAVARWNSPELFLIATTTVALGVGYAAWSFGLSLALGAFIAGLVINESEYAHQALSEVIPLRDLFGMLFFVSVGMLLDPALVWQRIGTVLIVVTVVVIGKVRFSPPSPVRSGTDALSPWPSASRCSRSASSRSSSRVSGWRKERSPTISMPWC